MLLCRWTQESGLSDCRFHVSVKYDRLTSQILPEPKPMVRSLMYETRRKPSMAPSRAERDRVCLSDVAMARKYEASQCKRFYLWPHRTQRAQKSPAERRARACKEHQHGRRSRCSRSLQRRRRDETNATVCIDSHRPANRNGRMAALRSHCTWRHLCDLSVNEIVWSVLRRSRA